MAKTGSIDLLLMRSGRTGWDEAGRLQGKTDLPLGESGRQAVAAELDELGSANGGVHLSSIYCGPDEASQETARLLAAKTGGRARTLPGLAAMNLGLWEGLLDTELLERYPSAFKQWRDDPASVNVPEGESMAEAEGRLAETLAKALDKATGKSVGVVLRPIEYGLARCWLANRAVSDLWSMLEDGPSSARVSLSREALRHLAERTRAGTSG